MCSISLGRAELASAIPGEGFRVARVAFPVRVVTDRESWGQMIFVLRIPLVESVLIVMVIVVFTMIVVISVLVVALSVSFSVALSHCGAHRHKE
jgi:hypothetical protein